VSVEVVESVLSRQIDDLEPTLTRHGYSIKDLVEQFDVSVWPRPMVERCPPV